MAYAEKTTVSVQKSKADIENLLKKYGANEFGYATKGNQAMVAFSMEGRKIRVLINMPVYEDLALTANGKKRTAIQIDNAYAQMERQRWRALLLIVKAKLEAIEQGITTFEEEFMANIVLPDGRTIAETILPQMETQYLEHGAPTLFLNDGL